MKIANNHNPYGPSIKNSRTEKQLNQSSDITSEIVFKSTTPNRSLLTEAIRVAKKAYHFTIGITCLGLLKLIQKIFRVGPSIS